MYKLSPSDFAYLYEECKLCYCLKVKENIYQPSMPMPGVFSAINTRLQGNLVGKNLRTLSRNLPEGVVVTQEGWVESVVVPGTNVFIKGKYDLLVKNSDGTHTLVDLKISQPVEDKIEKYKTQLGAYKFALENPASGEKIKISRLGLLIFYPDTVTFENGVARLDFPPKWLEIACDDTNFTNFIKDVDKLLTGPLPDEDQNCKWCAYRHTGENIIHKEEK
ncbi:MAG: PD-(D/E)XK nuclease family protein [Patescibacteria group bacterium]|nr:PD-(D/E)XK nuclease family protein [Patescibacteria group bacterium]